MVSNGEKTPSNLEQKLSFQISSNLICVYFVLTLNYLNGVRCFRFTWKDKKNLYVKKVENIQPMYEILQHKHFIMSTQLKLYFANNTIILYGTNKILLRRF